MIRPIIFCKAPVPGRVKTRMQTHFSPRQAADIHAAMACRVIEQVLHLYPNAWIAADDPRHAFFHRFDSLVLPQ